MNLSPAMSVTPRYFRDGQLLPGAIGGNLARVVRNAPSLRRVAFLFLEQPQQFGAQITDAGRGFPPFSSAGEGAVSRGFPSSHPPRPYIFLHVDHFTHRGAPIFVDETKFNRSAFA